MEVAVSMTRTRTTTITLTQLQHAVCCSGTLPGCTRWYVPTTSSVSCFLSSPPDSSISANWVYGCRPHTAQTHNCCNSLQPHMHAISATVRQAEVLSPWQQPKTAVQQLDQRVSSANLKCSTPVSLPANHKRGTGGHLLRVKILSPDYYFPLTSSSFLMYTLLPFSVT